MLWFADINNAIVDIKVAIVDINNLYSWFANMTLWGCGYAQYGFRGEYEPNDRILHSNSLTLEYAHVVTYRSTIGNMRQ